MNKKYHSIFKQLYFKDENINITSKPMMPQEFHILLYSTRVDAIANNNYMHQGLKSAFLRLIHESKNGDEIFYVFSSIAKKLQFIHLYCTLLYWVTDNFLLPYTTMANSNALKMCLRLFKNFCENYHKDPTVINRSVRSVQRTYNGETEDEYDEDNGIMTFIRDFLSQAVNFINVPKCKRSKMVNDLVRKNIDGFHSRFSDSRTSQDDDDENDDDDDDDDDDEENSDVEDQEEHDSNQDVSLEDSFDDDDEVAPEVPLEAEVEADVKFESDTLPPLSLVTESIHFDQNPIHLDQHSLYTIPENDYNSEMYMYEGIDSESSVLFKRAAPLQTQSLNIYEIEETSPTFIHEAEIHSNPISDPSDDVLVISPSAEHQKVQSPAENQNIVTVPDDDDDQAKAEPVEKVQSPTEIQNISDESESIVPLFSDLQIESAAESAETPNTEISEISSAETSEDNSNSVDNKQQFVFNTPPNPTISDTPNSSDMQRQKLDMQRFRERKRYDRLPTYYTSNTKEHKFNNFVIPEPDDTRGTTSSSSSSSSMEAEKQLEAKLADIISEGNKASLNSGSASDPNSPLQNIRKKREDSVALVDNSRFHPYKKPKYAKFTE